MWGEGKDELQFGHAELVIQAIQPKAAHYLHLVFEGETWALLYKNWGKKITELKEINLEG